MSKFCGNCGTVSDDTARICGNCGAPLDTTDAGATNIPGVSVDPEKQAKQAKMIKLGVIGVAAIIVIAIAISIISGFVGYKGAIRTIMNAYEEYDVDTLSSIASSRYFLSEDDYANEYFGKIVKNDLNDFEEYAGLDYDFSYEITDANEMSPQKLEDLMDALKEYKGFDPDIIDEVMVVEVKAVAEGKNRTHTKFLTITLTKEDGDWKLLTLLED